MVFNSALLIGGIGVGFALWLGIISFLLIRMISHYNKLTVGGTKTGLFDALEGIFRSIHNLQGRVGILEDRTNSIAVDGEFHVQRIGIVRFNPFADTGGAQSFSIALLDAQGSGVVMTSLYARAGNRWYVKEVVRGKGKELDLSKEEASVIEKAKQIGDKAV